MTTSSSLASSGLTPGTTIGDYKLEALLGEGGMGAVFLARSTTQADSEVALKVMLAQPSNPLWPMLRKRFLREARATMALNHPNVIQILSTFEHTLGPVIVMEVLRGMSLKEHLRRRRTLSVEETASIFVRIVSAVGAAHALGLVHRDLKPDNIFLTEDAPHVKVLDFGIAKLRSGGALAETSSLTKTGTMLGTPYYMSPEQAFGEKTIDHRADIWSLGLMLHETLTGTLPTRADELEEIFRRMMTMTFPRLDTLNPAVPASLASTVERMTQREPDARPTDLREVFNELSKHAPTVHSVDFSAAAEPLMFDEPSTGSNPSGNSPGVPAPGPALGASSAPLKLATGTLLMPASQKSPSKRPVETGAKTEIAAGPPSIGSGTIAGAPSAAAFDATTSSSVSSGSSEKKRGMWMWIVAAAIVLACVIVLATVLR